MSSQVSSPPTTGPGAPSEVFTNDAKDEMNPSSSMKVPSAGLRGRRTGMRSGGELLSVLGTSGNGVVSRSSLIHLDEDLPSVGICHPLDARLPRSQ